MSKQIAIKYKVTMISSKRWSLCQITAGQNPHSMTVNTRLKLESSSRSNCSTDDVKIRHHQLTIYKFQAQRETDDRRCQLSYLWPRRWHFNSEQSAELSLLFVSWSHCGAGGFKVTVKLEERIFIFDGSSSSLYKNAIKQLDS